MTDIDHKASVDLVMQDAFLVKNILKHCQHCTEGIEDLNTDPHAKPDFHKYLKQTTLVNRLWHQVSSELIYKKMYIDNYCRIHPDMAPNESVSKSFEFYQSCVRTITFPIMSYLLQNIPFLSNQNKSLHYLSVQLPIFDVSTTLVDLRKRTIKVKSTAYLDNNDKVHILPVEEVHCHGNNKVCVWPRGYKMIRRLALLPKREGEVDSLITPFAQQSITVKSPTPAEKIRTLDNILNHHELPDENDMTDEEYISSATIKDINDMKLVSRLLEYPLLETLSIDNDDISEDDFKYILKVGKLRYMCIGKRQRMFPGMPLPENQNSPEWSADKLYSFIQAYAESPKSIQNLAMIVSMTKESVWELRDMTTLSSSARSEQGLSARITLVYYQDPFGQPDQDAQSVTDLNTEEGAESWRKLFPQWSWIAADRILPQHQVLNLDISIEITSPMEPGGQGMGPGYTILGGFGPVMLGAGPLPPPPPPPPHLFHP